MTRAAYTARMQPAPQLEQRRECLLLAREWRDTRDGLQITLWGVAESGAVKVELPSRAVMFVPRRTPLTLTSSAKRAPVELRSLQGEPVDALYFESQRELVRTRGRLREELMVGLESDLKPSDRFLMERFITSAFEVVGPAEQRAGVTYFQRAKVRAAEPSTQLVSGLKVLSLDLETVGTEVRSIALVGCGVEEVMMKIGADQRVEAPFVSSYASERELLTAFSARLASLDPDVLIGWNVIEFDLLFLERAFRRLKLPFTLGRGREEARILEGEKGQVAVARIPGRVVLDGIATLKNASRSFERFTLEHVARELLGRGKKIASSGASKVSEITRLADEDPEALAAYNLEDARLVAEIFNKTELVRFAFARAALSGLAPDRQGGSVAAFDHLYLPLLHRAGFVAPDVGTLDDSEESPGGEVLNSVPGLHHHVLSFDFRSLYPSIIRTFKIDPLGLALGLSDDPPGGRESLVRGFDGAWFTRSPSILPVIIERLTTARRSALEQGDAALAQAIKLQMNSFYGVLGTPGCRFFDGRLASSITRRGHELIRRLCEFFEQKEMRVLYGDTDSVFVLAAPSEDYAALGRSLAAEANRVLERELRERFELDCALELRFDLHFTSFLMPTMRGTEIGSKKRYAGATLRGEKVELVIKGLEAVRTDWTPLARRVQRELLLRVFTEQPWRDWLLGLRQELLTGALDEELVYKKKLRRDLADYEHAPPHVRAARMLEGTTEWGAQEVEYVMTQNGPLPASRLQEKAHGQVIDYDHYLDKQLAPACDVVLSILGSSFAEVAGRQLKLF
jgi:DNA polymerase-2